MILCPCVLFWNSYTVGHAAIQEVRVMVLTLLTIIVNRFGRQTNSDSILSRRLLFVQWRKGVSFVNCVYFFVIIPGFVKQIKIYTFAMNLYNKCGNAWITRATELRRGRRKWSGVEQIIEPVLLFGELKDRWRRISVVNRKDHTARKLCHGVTHTHTDRMSPADSHTSTADPAGQAAR